MRAKARTVTLPCIPARSTGRLVACAALAASAIMAMAQAGRAGQAGQAGRSPVKVFIFAGQSNMEGQGRVSHLDDLTKDAARRATFGHLKTPGGQWVVRRDVWIVYGDRKGGLSVGYGARGDRIGPELQAGHVLGDHLDNQVLIVKCAWGGKSLKVNFRPPSSGGETGPFYTQTVERVHEVLGDIRRFFPEYDGRGYEIAGFAWFQGWNDMINGEAVAEYEENFANLVRDLRKEFKAPDMPAVIAETGNCGNASFRKAQAAVAERPEFKATMRFVPTSEYIRSEPAFDRGYHWHGNAESYFLIGEAMGKAMAALVPTLSAKELTRSTRPILGMIDQMRYASAHAAIVKLEKKLEETQGAPASDGDATARERDVVRRLKALVLRRVDATVEEVKHLDGIGDVYRASMLIRESRQKFKGIDRYDEAVDPVRKSLTKYPKTTEVRLGAQYYYLMGLAGKKRDARVLMAIRQLAARYPKSAYGRAAKAALKDLQDPNAKLRPSGYFGASE